MVTLICHQCNQPFSIGDWELKQRTPRFCSITCMGLAKRTPPITRICLECGETFTVAKRAKDKAERKYCGSKCGAVASGRAKRRDLAERLWSSVTWCDHGDDCPYCCWLWTGATTTPGEYGKITPQGRKTSLLTHRVAWELWNDRSIPKDREIAHYCHVRLCCNPLHIRPATRSENREDARRDGRPPYVRIDREAIYQRDRGICHICHLPVPHETFTIDHIIARKRGGKNEPGNLAVAHSRCNYQKGAK